MSTSRPAGNAAAGCTSPLSRIHALSGISASLHVIASIEEPAVIERNIKHLGREAVPIDPAHPSRALPRSDRLI